MCGLATSAVRFRAPRGGDVETIQSVEELHASRASATELVPIEYLGYRRLPALELVY